VEELEHACYGERKFPCSYSGACESAPCIDGARDDDVFIFEICFLMIFVFEDLVFDDLDFLK
jgi:hypothetical protein